jgi:NADPH:quinone reductase-like Zn-dependent oxidoreductase
MKAYEIGAQTGVDALTATTRPMPEAGPGEVVLKVRLVCLGARDVQIVEGRYGPKKLEARVPVSEGLGEIVALGEGVDGLAVGDRVIGTHFTGWIDGAFTPRYFGVDYGVTHDGWLAEYVKLPAHALVKVPDSVGDEQAAALSASALTAWHAVVEVGQVKAGDLVLALGTGGVAIWALQIAKAHGALVAITSSSDEKLELARKLGADYTVNYRTHPDWDAELLRQTGGRGADIVAETGGQGTQAKSVAAAAPNGRIVFISVAGGDQAAPLNVGATIGKNLTLKGIAAGSRAMLQALVHAVAANDIQPVIDRHFAFDEAVDAYNHLKAAGHVGKVMIRVAN